LCIISQEQAKFRNDRLHIALATVHGVDVVASWNFRYPETKTFYKNKMKECT
jgi:hypothetical protein